MKTLLLILISFTAFAQKGEPSPTRESVTVLKIDSTEREKIEQWTLKNTFPDIIVFIKDSLGNYIVGQEVLSDPAFEKICTLDSREEKPLREYLEEKTDTTTYRPKPSDTRLDSGETKPRDTTNPK